MAMTISYFALSPLLNYSISSSSMAICGVCKDFSSNRTNEDIPVLDLDIMYSNLTRSSNKGGPACSMIREGREASIQN
jgi:hypothetical protein